MWPSRNGHNGENGHTSQDPYQLICPIPMCNKALERYWVFQASFEESSPRDSNLAAFISPGVKFVVPVDVMRGCFQCQKRFGDTDEFDSHIPDSQALEKQVSVQVQRGGWWVGWVHIQGNDTR